MTQKKPVYVYGHKIKGRPSAAKAMLDQEAILERYDHGDEYETDNDSGRILDSQGNTILNY